MAILELFMLTTSNQFGVEKQQSICVYLYLAKYYNNFSSSIYSRLLVASKSSDKTGHWTSFEKMTKRFFPSTIIRIITLDKIR